MRQHLARFPIEGNDTFESEIEAHEGPRFASIRLDLPRVDFHWASGLTRRRVTLFWQVLSGLQLGWFLSGIHDVFGDLINTTGDLRDIFQQLLVLTLPTSHPRLL